MWKSRGSTVQTGRTILQEYKSTAMYDVFRVNSFVSGKWGTIRRDHVESTSLGPHYKKIHKLC